MEKIIFYSNRERTGQVVTNYRGDFIIKYLDDCKDCGFTEDISPNNLYVPRAEDYVSLEEVEYEEGEVEEFAFATEYQGRSVTLNKPFRTPGGPKKFAVYVKNERGKVVIVRFGDPNMKIKKNIPERRKSFRARHNCSSPGPKWKARYWACKSW